MGWAPDFSNWHDTLDVFVVVVFSYIHGLTVNFSFFLKVKCMYWFLFNFDFVVNIKK